MKYLPACCIVFFFFGVNAGIEQNFIKRTTQKESKSLFYVGTTPPAQRTIVPIHQKVFGDHSIRYSIPVTIGHTTVEAMLDTGSPGIWILPGATQPGDFTATARKNSINYASGVKLNAVFADATITIGGINSTAPIPISAVQTIGCDSARPNCAVLRMPQQDFRLGGSGNPREGFMAIIGVNIGGDAKVNNPLPQIGVHNWIIILPKPGDKKPGELILNPDQSDLTGYTLFHINMTSTPKDGIPSCIKNMRTNKEVCGATMLDTGAPGVHVVSGRQGNNQPIHFKPGDPVQISFSNGNGESVPPETFIDSTHSASHITVSPPKKHQVNNTIYAGIVPFFAYSVLYESDQNMIGLKSRESQFTPRKINQGTMRPRKRNLKNR
jgi:hypothetical protein